MILSMGLHMMEATLSSMTLKALNLVQRMRLRLFGTSLRSDLQHINCKISCMQFGKHLYICSLYGLLIVDISKVLYTYGQCSPHPAHRT